MLDNNIKLIFTMEHEPNAKRMNADNKKNLTIETIRGVAILLVVMGHVIGSAPDGGMKIDFPHPLRYLYVWIDYIQMPLFTAIAGWVYALKGTAASESFITFARKKALRLLLPMAVVGTLYFMVQYLMPGTNAKGELREMWRIYIFPYTIYWYLPSLFLIFIVQWCIDRYKKMKSLRQWFLWCFVASLLSVVNDSGFMHELPNLLSFKGALGQLPYFFVGIASCRFSSQVYSAGLSVRILLWLGTLLGIGLIQSVWFSSSEWSKLSHDLYILTTLPTLLLLLGLKSHNRFFIWLGGYAYSIYLFHGFGTSGGRILLKMVGVKAIAIVFPIATAIALVLPIIVDKMASRYDASRSLLLGKAKKRSIIDDRP